jgi:hypothetical protein
MAKKSLEQPPKRLLLLKDTRSPLRNMKKNRVSPKVTILLCHKTAQAFSKWQVSNTKSWSKTIRAAFPSPRVKMDGYQVQKMGGDAGEWRWGWYNS